MPSTPPQKPCLLEDGLPCASLSAECQRDNNARQRPPQNRLHIWWARRPPTISRAAILAALLPADYVADESLLPEAISEPSEDDVLNLPGKFQEHALFFRDMLRESAMQDAVSPSHQSFLRVLGVHGNVVAATKRIQKAKDYHVGHKGILMPPAWGYRHLPAFRIVPPQGLLMHVLTAIKKNMAGVDQDIVVLDYMAGGGCIPLEGVRFGFKVYANDLNPVAATVLKATLEYPARFGPSLAKELFSRSRKLADAVGQRLRHYFHQQDAADWWQDCETEAVEKFAAKTIVERMPADKENIQAFLWCRTVPCTNCGLNIPISTNFLLVSKKGRPEASVAAFPVVPNRDQGNDCTFRIVKRNEWPDCRWPAPDFRAWHPRNTPTFSDGKAICPRCGNVMDGDRVKEIGRSSVGGLPAQLYAIVSKVPVRLTYQNGDQKIRYMWRHRTPTQADLDALERAAQELALRTPDWLARGLLPDEAIPEGDKTKEPLNMGIAHWRDLFLPRQLLTNMIVLEEIRKAQDMALEELPKDQAEAVCVYLAFILSKINNYNSVNTFWHYGRQTVAQSFSRHDFAFRPAFCEFEGARESVLWAAGQVIDAYDELARLIHGAAVDDRDVALDDDGEDADDLLEAATDVAEETESLSDSDAETDRPDAPRAPSADIPLRPEVRAPTVTCEDAASLSQPAPGSVHLICVDPPYYKNVQYAELSNFFYVWLKRSLGHIPGLAHLFHEPLAETGREAVANAARWAREAEREISAWQTAYDAAFHQLRAEKVKIGEARQRAFEIAGARPLTANERADVFYEDKMAAVFRRAKTLLHPAGRMVVMFNHKQTRAWRSLGMALIRAGFEVRSSVPIHTEAESSLNIRGLDAARSTVLLLCLPRQEREQSVGNWGKVQQTLSSKARQAAKRLQEQGLAGTDLYLSALGPALGVVGRNWPVTDFSGRPIDMGAALDHAYFSVGQWRLEQIFAELSTAAEHDGMNDDYKAESADRNTQALWLWLDTFEGETAHTDDVRKLANSLGVNPDELKKNSLLSAQKDVFFLRPPQDVDLRLLSKRLQGEKLADKRTSREADIWEERSFPGFIGAAVWNAIALMSGAGVSGLPAASNIEALRRWLVASGYGSDREFFGAYAVTLHLLEKVFSSRQADDSWGEATVQARRAWDLLLSSWRG